MSRTDLIADFAAALHDALSVFEGNDTADEPAADAMSDALAANLSRMLDNAARDFARFRPRVLTGAVQLTAGSDMYPAPADMYQYLKCLWGNDQRRLQPWEAGASHSSLPRVELVDYAAESATDTSQWLVLSPAPTVGQIAMMGATFRFLYHAHHIIGDRAPETTIRAFDRDLLLLRAEAEAMREIASRNSFKPVQMREGLHAGPRNTTAAALFGVYVAEFERRMLQRVSA